MSWTWEMVLAQFHQLQSVVINLFYFGMRELRYVITVVKVVSNNTTYILTARA